MNTLSVAVKDNNFSCACSDANRYWVMKGEELFDVVVSMLTYGQLVYDEPFDVGELQKYLFDVERFLFLASLYKVIATKEEELLASKNLNNLKELKEAFDLPFIQMYALLFETYSKIVSYFANYSTGSPVITCFQFIAHELFKEISSVEDINVDKIYHEVFLTKIKPSPEYSEIYSDVLISTFMKDFIYAQQQWINMTLPQLAEKIKNTKRVILEKFLVKRSYIQK